MGKHALTYSHYGQLFALQVLKGLLQVKSVVDFFVSMFWAFVEAMALWINVFHLRQENDSLKYNSQSCYQYLGLFITCSHLQGHWFQHAKDNGGGGESRYMMQWERKEGLKWIFSLWAFQTDTAVCKQSFKYLCL